LINQIIFLTTFDGFEAKAMQNVKTLWLPGLRPGPHWGAYSALPDPLAEINNILFEIMTEMSGKSNSEIVTPINIISDCTKE